MQQPTPNKQCTLAQTHKQFGAWINAIVHSIMYLYYGLTAARFNTAPFKQAVTSVQLTQFCMCIAHAVTVVVVRRSRWLIVTDTDELIGVLSRASALPQYLITAMLVGDETVSWMVSSAVR